MGGLSPRQKHTHDLRNYAWLIIEMIQLQTHPMLQFLVNCSFSGWSPDIFGDCDLLSRLPQPSLNRFENPCGFSCWSLLWSRFLNTPEVLHIYRVERARLCLILSYWLVGIPKSSEYPTFNSKGMYQFSESLFTLQGTNGRSFWKVPW